MNIHDPNIATPKVTTGPLSGSRKVYARPDAAPDLRVPLRHIQQSAASPELGRLPCLVGHPQDAEGEHVVLAAMPERVALVAALVTDLLRGDQPPP